MNCLLLSDFNIQNLATYLNGSRQGVPIDSVKSSYGEVHRVLADRQAEEWLPRPDFTVVWTRPDGVLLTFARLLDGDASLTQEALISEIDDYVALLVSASERTGSLFVPQWTLPPYRARQGVFDLCSGLEPARALLLANQRLLERLEGHPRVVPLQASRWLDQAGPGACSPRLWYLGKIPFANAVFRAAATDLHAAIRGLSGGPRKVIICDLDETLWGGVVGDEGWQSLVLGGHDPVGEALVDFQRALRTAARKGVLLAIVSKNDEATALDAIRRHPEMILRPADFSAWRINWNDKAENIVGLMSELNLGLDAAVFIDDSPAERARVREALPDVLVPDWPIDKRLYPQAFLALDCFDRPRLTLEDRDRTAMYAAERRRGELKRSVQSLDEWIDKLGISVQVERLSHESLPRATQLLNKTNQMNLASRRLREAELIGWREGSKREVFSFRVSDRLGDSGLAGLMSVSMAGETVRVVDFLLSCRVFGRRVEEAMLHVAVAWARLQRAEAVCAEYVPTARNKPCLEFFRRSGFTEEEAHLFVWRTEAPYPAPPAVAFTLPEWLAQA